MKKILISLGLFLILAFGMLTTADAAIFFDMGAGSWVDASGTQDVLQMYANVNPGLGGISFYLNPGDSYTMNFATIGTNENWINWGDDVNPGSLVAHIDFAVPNLVQAVNGSSVGVSGIFQFWQGWSLTWDGPVLVDFGDGGQFSIELSDAWLLNCGWYGPSGERGIDLTIALITEPQQSATPEPMTMALFGIGLAGAGMLKGRKKRCGGQKV